MKKIILLFTLFAGFIYSTEKSNVSQYLDKRVLAAIDDEKNQDIKDLKALVGGKTELGETALIYAVKQGKSVVVPLLMNLCNINDVDNEGNTALLWSAKNGDSQRTITRLLIDKGANLDVQNNEGYSALIYAVKYGHIKTTQLLINNGAKLDLQNNEGNTALIYSTFHSNSVMTSLLLEKGADPDLKNKREEDALTLAELDSNFPLISSLIFHKANGVLASKWQNIMPEILKRQLLAYITLLFNHNINYRNLNSKVYLIEKYYNEYLFDRNLRFKKLFTETEFKAYIDEINKCFDKADHPDDIELCIDPRNYIIYKDLINFGIWTAFVYPHVNEFKKFRFNVSTKNNNMKNGNSAFKPISAPTPDEGSIFDIVHNFTPPENRPTSPFYSTLNPNENDRSHSPSNCSSAYWHLNPNNPNNKKS